MSLPLVSASVGPGDAAFDTRALDAAEQHLFTQGYRSLDLPRLAAALEVAPAVLLASYANEEAITLAVLRRMQLSMGAFFDELQLREFDPVAFLRENMRFVTSTVGFINPVFYAEIKQGAPAVWAQVQAFRRAQLQRLEGVIASGCEAGLLRADLDPKLATIIYLAAVEAVGDPERMATDGYSLTTALEAVLAVFLDGIRVQLDS